MGSDTGTSNTMGSNTHTGPSTGPKGHTARARRWHSLRRGHFHCTIMARLFDPADPMSAMMAGM